VKNPATYHNKQINLAGVLCNYNLQQSVMCIELKKKELKTGQLWLRYIQLIRIRRLWSLWTGDFVSSNSRGLNSNVSTEYPHPTTYSATIVGCCRQLKKAQIITQAELRRIYVK